jgi:mono/diheme cytochrome c family protein
MDWVARFRQAKGVDIMSRITRWRGLRWAGVPVFAMLWLILLGVPLVLPVFGPIRPAAAQYPPFQDPGGQVPGGVDPFGQVPGDDPDMPLPGRSKSKSARKKTRLLEKGATKKTDPTTKAKAKGNDSGGLRFSQDIAPILVANCNRCHTKDGAGVRRGKFDLSTFEKLQTGTPDHKVIVPGKPAESHLVLRINGEEDPKMPQGANTALSADAIAKITRWVKEGAQLDAGMDPKVAIDTYAASPEQLRRRQLAQTPVKERDQKVIETGLARWKQSGAKQKPEVAPGTHFIMFSTEPSDRATSTLKGMETQYTHLKPLLGTQAMDWPEKVSLYVFKNNNEFVEFVRSVETREVDSGEPRSSVRFNVPAPYIAVMDPTGGKKEEPARRRSKGKRSEEPAAAAAASDRSLLGVLTEALGSGSVGAAGNAPRWLREGIGAYMAARVEPRSVYYHQLRQTAFQNVQQGWQTRATQALGDQLGGDDQRAVSFALVECMMGMDAAEHGQRFTVFLQGMLERGPAALDDMLAKVYGGSRDEYLNDTGEWVAGKYGRAQ